MDSIAEGSQINNIDLINEKYLTGLFTGVN